MEFIQKSESWGKIIKKTHNKQKKNFQLISQRAVFLKEFLIYNKKPIKKSKYIGSQTYGTLNKRWSSSFITNNVK